MKTKLFTFFLVSILVLSGCNDGKFNSLVEQGTEHYVNNELKSALVVYEKALEIKEDSDVRSKTSEIKKEISLAKEMTEHANRMLEIKSLLKKEGDASKINKYSDELNSIISSIEALDDSGYSNVAKYITSFKNSGEFSSVVNYNNIVYISSNPILQHGTKLIDVTHDLANKIDALFQEYTQPDAKFKLQ